MGFALLDKEFNDSKKIVLDSAFILDYMPLAPEGYVKVYLLAFALASSGNADLDVICAKLDMPPREVLQAFEFWANRGLMRLEQSPLCVIFNKVVPIGKQILKFDKTKYGAFNEQLHKLLDSRPISKTEYNEYYTIMEAYGLEEAALLNIVGYCKALKKKDDISHRYIIKVAYDFVDKGFRTFESVNEHIEKTALYQTDLIELYKALKIKKVPDYLDKQLLAKWKSDFAFDMPTILHSAKQFADSASSKTSIEKFDTELTLYNKKRLTTIETIDKFVAMRKANIALAKEITTSLGIFEPYDFAVEVYIEPWLNFGFNGEVLLLVASNCKQLPYYKRNLKAIEHNFIMPLANDKKFSVEEVTAYFSQLNNSGNHNNTEEGSNASGKAKKGSAKKADDTVVAAEGNKNFISRKLSAQELNKMFDQIYKDDL